MSLVQFRRHQLVAFRAVPQSSECDARRLTVIEPLLYAWESCFVVQTLKPRRSEFRSHRLQREGTSVGRHHLVGKVKQSVFLLPHSRSQLNVPVNNLEHVLATGEPRPDQRARHCLLRQTLNCSCVWCQRLFGCWRLGFGLFGSRCRNGCGHCTLASIGGGGGGSDLGRRSGVHLGSMLDGDIHHEQPIARTRVRSRLWGICHPQRVNPVKWTTPPGDLNSAPLTCDFDCWIS